MLKTLAHERVSITSSGSINLPSHLQQSADLKPGDELLVIWQPPDTFILRKSSDIVANDKLFAAAMHELDQALTEAGYPTDENVRTLVQKVKKEQYAEWDEG